MNTTNIKTTLIMPDPPNNFGIRNITLRISKDKKINLGYSQYTYKEFYIQGKRICK